MIETNARKSAITFSAVITDLVPATPCGYQWAYQEFTELSAQFDTALKKMIPHSTSHAIAFGENCFNNKGKFLQFLPREINFYVTITTEYAADHGIFGNWIRLVMQFINDPSLGLTSGITTGFVEFNINFSQAKITGYRVTISQYNDMVSILSGQDLFRMYYTNP